MEERGGGFEAVGCGAVAGETDALVEEGHALVVVLGCYEAEDVDEGGFEGGVGGLEGGWLVEE